ncbi:hypothetical protein DW1_1955 [Proteiniborus sp. DW1]|uniref:DUF5665 domain-containing protein n=1 Tax=Proteiniborus sp. DW1 TaxID=1889883 RepID=UPI00092E0783|nr:DUF5665 domain-containing protein [Proteiniborus sp. DW1]SCG83523.1 hypothetical protein DW1_1955 [Proteiniborus sp. DW1]
MSKNNEIEKRLEELANNLEKAKLHEYVDFVNNKKRLLYVNFLGGLARGFGMAIGFTILGALAIYFLNRIISWNIPLIGDFIAEIVRIVQERL